MKLESFIASHLIEGLEVKTSAKVGWYGIKVVFLRHQFLPSLSMIRTTAVLRFYCAIRK